MGFFAMHAGHGQKLHFGIWVSAHLGDPDSIVGDARWRAPFGPAGDTAGTATHAPQEIYD
jgi:hypothetical protein